MAGLTDTGDLARALTLIPTLTRYGVGSQDYTPLTEEDMPNIDKARVWLRANIAPTRTILRSPTSYGLKHLAEDAIGYLTNGEFIAAAVLEGYPFRLVPPNVQFGMSKRSIQALRAAS